MDRAAGEPQVSRIFSTEGATAFRAGEGFQADDGPSSAVSRPWSSSGCSIPSTIDPQEVGVELQFGKPKPVLSEPGLHFHWWPVESVERVNVTENQTEIGSVGGRNGTDEGLMLSGDQNIVDVRFAVLWAVSNPEQFLFNVRDPDDMVRSAGESAMREVVGRRPAQDIFRDDQAGIALQVQEITQAILLW
jgi:membrane protease subunit HflK